MRTSNTVGVLLASMMLTLVGVAARAGERAAPSPTVPQAFGVNIHFTDPSPGEMRRFAEGGFGWARMDFFWAGIEREPGRYDFAAYDRLAEQLKNAGARPLFILDYSHPRYDGGLSPRTTEGRAAFARFAAAAAGHFRGRGVCWEIWNEPNIDFWKPTPNADDYAKLALETAQAVRAADPDATILAPGSSEFPWPYFETIFAAGLIEHIDAVSVHPYRPTAPETAADDFGRLRALIARHAPPSRRMLPIVSSEWGYSTADPAIGEPEQARYLVRQWLSNLANGVNLSIFYDWRDDGDDPSEREHRFGVVRRDLEPKPSFLAARDLIRALRGYTFRQRLQGATPAEWTLLFQRGDQPDAPLALVSWSTGPKAGEVARTPKVEPMAADDPRAADYRRLAAIRFPAGPLAEGAGDGPRLDVRVVNPDAAPADVAFVVVGVKAHGDAGVVKVAPGGNAILSLRLREAVLRAERRSIPLAIQWNARSLPAIVPLQVWRADPLRLTVAPRGSALHAVVDNPSKLPFQGRLTATTEGVEQHVDLVIAPEQAQGEASLPDGARAARVRLLNERKQVVAEPPPGRFEPIRGVGDPDLLTELESRLYVDNAPEAPTLLRSTPSDDGPALEIPFRFDRGWRYLTVEPRRTTPIPADAREAVFWIKADRTGDHLRCRFTDSTGQTFQPDLGRLDADGWRIVRAPLDGSGPGGRWGGANDGVPHPPLAWQAVVLIDSADRETPHGGILSLTSPSYRLEK